MNDNLMEELIKQRTVKDIFLFIKTEWLEKIAMILLCLICVFPLLGHFLIVGIDYTRFSFAINSVGRTGVVFGLFVVIWNYYRFGFPKRRFTLTINNGLPLFLLAMFFWSILSCAFSTNPVISFYGDAYRLEGLSTYIAYAGIFVLASNIKTEYIYKFISEIFVASASLLSLICFINYQRLSFAFSIYFTNRAIFANINHYGYYLCMALPLAVGLFVTDIKMKNSIRIVLRTTELVLLSCSLIKAKSMGPLIAVMAALIAMIVLTVFVNRKSLKRVLCASLIVVTVCTVTSLGTWNIFGDFEKTVSDASILGAAVTSEEAGRTSDSEQKLMKIGSNRGILWVNALKFIEEKPVFGYGPDNLGEAYARAGANNDRPHNEILQFAASLGIPAAMFYISGLTCLLLMFIRKFEIITMEVLCIYCVVGSYLVSSMFGNTMFYTSPFYFMLLGMCYARIKAIT